MLRYNKYIRRLLVKTPKWLVGETLHNIILDFLYPDDAVLKFKKTRISEREVMPMDV